MELMVQCQWQSKWRNEKDVKPILFFTKSSSIQVFYCALSYYDACIYRYGKKYSTGSILSPAGILSVYLFVCFFKNLFNQSWNIQVIKYTLKRCERMIINNASQVKLYYKL
jgi:hypothetical protein